MSVVWRFLHILFTEIYTLYINVYLYCIKCFHVVFQSHYFHLCVIYIYIYDWKKKTHYCHLLLYSHMYTCIYTYTHSYTTINKNHVFFFNIELFQSLFLRTYAHKILPPSLPSYLPHIFNVYHDHVISKFVSCICTIFCMYVYMKICLSI